MPDEQPHVSDGPSFDVDGAPIRWKMVVDYIVLVVPRDVDPAEPLTRDRLIECCNAAIYGQYVGDRPAAVLLEEPEWHICLSDEDMATARPVHQCDTCTAGHDKARLYLREHPDEALAVANLHFTEVWP